MLHTVEGIYKNGTIQLSEIPPNISESKVLITFVNTELDTEPEKKTSNSSKMIYFGMFSGENQSTEADFHEAEFNGDCDDNLDWQ